MDVEKYILDKTDELKSGNGHVNVTSQKHDHKTKSKEVDKPYKKSQNASLGAHLVATRQIRPGELVMREKCTVWGPQQLTSPICLGCGKGITVETSIPCGKCGWPMCSAKCEEAEAHIPECYYTQKKGIKMSIKEFVYPNPNYQCITALRVLYQRDHNPKLWETFMKLEAHSNERIGTQIYKDDEIFVAKFIREFFHLEEVFSNEEILRVCGMIQINGYNAPLGYITIYIEAASFEHSCIANCTKTFKADGEIILTAAGSIEEGDHLSECYSESLWGTVNRRRFLYETNYFACICKRCKDPTDLGTHFNSLKCQNSDCQGFVLPDNFQSHPTEESVTIWKCNICDYHLSANEVQIMLDRIGEDLKTKKGSSKNCQIFLDHYRKYLHENHYYMTEVKLDLCQLIGKENDHEIKGVSEEDLKLKLELCQKLLDLFKTIVPADLRLRGTVLFELYTAMSENARRLAYLESASSDEMKLMMIKSKSILDEAIDALQYEPEESPEGKILIRAQKTSVLMEKILQKACDSISEALVELDI